ncbi:hypothetical protein JD844_006153 [Phrynosoma platyrhinos]|uniref:DED domain-containing protein n=1 Tax=Phrynosoma platyrhinos TaxID=52577 RepID=A0ABQ7TQ23_PHRPL|nr:hypothetical protein JD844_006153 [Phrynosoma platyrhinos]
MAVSEARRPLSSSSSSSSAFSFSQAWEEEECLEYYGMISLHRMFEVVGAQLTENDVEVLSFLLDETQPWTHPLDPALWAVAAAEEGAPEATSPVLEGWRKKQQGRRGCQGAPAEAEGSLEGGALGRQRPKNGGGGVQLLLELERRGKCDETNFVRLLQLLRVLTRHDLLPYVTLKRQRTVSPERYTYGPSVLSSEQQVDSCLNSASAEPRNDQWETGSNSSKRKRVSRGRAKSVPPRRRRGGKAASAPKQEVQTPTKVTCEWSRKVEIHPWKSISIGSGKRAKYQTMVKIPRQTKKQKPKTVALFNASPILEATLHLDPAALLLNKL